MRGVSRKNLSMPRVMPAITRGDVTPGLPGFQTGSDLTNHNNNNLFFYVDPRREMGYLPWMYLFLLL